MSSHAYIEDANVTQEIVGHYFDVVCCPRCDGEHSELAFEALEPKFISEGERELDPYVGDFWGNCPVNGQWLLLRSDKLPGGGYEVAFDFSEPT